MNNQPPENAPPPPFAEAQAEARKAAEQLTEEDIAFGLDGQHEFDPQGGIHRSNPVTSRVEKPTNDWASKKEPKRGPSTR